MTIEIKRTKAEIERDLAASLNAAEMVPHLQKVASRVKEHEAELESWETEGGWGRRETQARIEAESISRAIRDKQNELVLLLKECEDSPLFKAIGNIYQTQALRAELIKTCQDSTYASFQRALQEAKEASEVKLSYQAVSAVAANYGESHTQRLVEQVDAGYRPLRGLTPGSKAEAIGHIVLELAYPAKRTPLPIDTNLRGPSPFPTPIEGAAAHPGATMTQLANNSLGLTGKTPGRAKEGLYHPVRKGLLTGQK